MKMAKRNKELKALIKEVISEEALVQEVALMENNVASLQEENKINANLKQEPAWRKNEHTMIIKEKKGFAHECGPIPQGSSVGYIN